MSPVSSAMEMNTSGETNPRSRMRPAHQRLEFDNCAGAHVDDRLVENAEFVIRQAAAHVGLDLQPFGRPHFHVGLEYDVPSLALSFGGVQGQVGVPHQVVTLDIVFAAQRDADAGLHKQLATLDVEWRLQTDQQSVRDVHRVGMSRRPRATVRTRRRQTAPPCPKGARNRLRAAPEQPAAGRRPRVRDCR